MPTARDILTRAAKSINYISRNQTLNPTDIADAFATLNEMLASWNREALMLYTTSRQTLSITASDGDYTWGSSGDITAIPRADWLSGASYLIGTGTSQLEQPIHVIQTIEEWQCYTLKNQTSTYPDRVWYDPVYPLGLLYFRPIPTGALTAILYAAARLTEISTLDTSISLPDGFLRAIRYNIALELTALFNVTLAPTSVVPGLAVESKAWIKSSNMKPRPIVPDFGATGPNSGGQFNILAGDNSGKLLHS